MGQRLTPSQKLLYRRVDEVLHYLWDPIGVKEVPEARDEYEGYLGPVFSLLINEAGEDAIVDYLVSVESRWMGLTAAPDHARFVAELLIDYQDLIRERASREG